jgi:hypothetical protein
MLETLDETQQIDDLLEEIAPLDTTGLPTMPNFPVAKPTAPPSVRRWSPGAMPTGLFLRKVNWSNDDNYEAPRPRWLDQEAESLESPSIPTEEVALCPGAIPLRRFLQLVNWENREQAPHLPTFEAPAPAKATAGGNIVEDFFSQFGFE